MAGVIVTVAMIIMITEDIVAGKNIITDKTG
jgi:hypothetical protein